VKAGGKSYIMSFIVYIFTKYYKGDQIIKDEMVTGISVCIQNVIWKDCREETTWKK
jgi:hypothetical protein